MSAQESGVLERRNRMGGTWICSATRIRPMSICTATATSSPVAVAKGSRRRTTIRNYIEETAREHGIEDKIHYGLKILSANWSSAEQQWKLDVLHEASGTMRSYSCSFLIGCTGYYNQ